MYAYTGMKVFYSDTGFTSARKKKLLLHSSQTGDVQL